MLKIVQLFIGILTVCDAFQGSYFKVTMKNSFLKMSVDDDEKNVPRLARDSMMQPMQRGKVSYTTIIRWARIFATDN